MELWTLSHMKNFLLIRISLCIDKNILIYDNRLYFDSAMDKNKQMKVSEKG